MDPVRLLPSEVMQMIFILLCDQKPEKLYTLRAISKAWKSCVDAILNRWFTFWNHECQRSAIPKDWVATIVTSKFPLLAHPWQHHYWADSGMPHVAKAVYTIYHNLPHLQGHNIIQNVDAIDDTVCSNSIGPNSTPRYITVNDKYLAVSTTTQTAIYDLKNLSHCSPLLYPVATNWMSFYATHYITILFLTRKSMKIGYDVKYLLTIKESPHRSVQLLKQFEHSSESRFLITQNECFLVRKNKIHHQILKEDHFEIITTIDIPCELDGSRQIRVDICGSHLYVTVTPAHFNWRGKCLNIYKYDISRNSNGHLFFTRNKSYQSVVYAHSYVDHPFGVKINCQWYVIDQSTSNSLSHGWQHSISIDFIIETKKIERWMSQVYNGAMRMIVVHGGYVFCGLKNRGNLMIFRKEEILAGIEADTSDDLQPLRIISWDYQSSMSDLIDIFVVYVGEKMRIVLHTLASIYLLEMV